MAQKDVLSNSLLTLLWTLVHATVSVSALTPLSYDSSEVCRNDVSYCRKYTTHFHLLAKFKVYAQLSQGPAMKLAMTIGKWTWTVLYQIL